jgi:hypothetical protein
MGAFDQAARYAAQTVPEVVTQRLLLGCGTSLVFREWYDTRAMPLPRGPDRTADLVAQLDNLTIPEQPWLLIIEFQAQVELDKLDVTLEETAILRNRARHGEDKQGRYNVTAGMVYLVERCPQEVLNMTLPDGTGTRHAPRIWNVAADDAVQTLEAVATDKESWAMLFWVPLMADADQEAVIERWKELVLTKVEERGRRGDLAFIARTFAQLALRGQEWNRQLKGFDMTESQVAQEVRHEGEIKARQEDTLTVLEDKFPSAVTEELIRVIKDQDSLVLLNQWFRTALRATNLDDFIAVLRG